LTAQEKRLDRRDGVGYALFVGVRADERELIVENIFAVVTWNLGSFVERMQKLVKKAQKLGCDTVGFDVLDSFDKVVVRETYDGFYKQKISFTNVRVFGAAPKFAGWSLIGRLDFKSVPGATVRAMVPGHECPAEFQAVEPGRCDHCHASRRRNDSFLCQHEDGRVVVVGRQCIADFLGNESPEHIAALATCLADIGRVGGDDEGGHGGRVRDEHEIGYFVAVTAYCVRTYGWVPRSAAANGADVDPTASRVLRLLCPQLDAAREAHRLAELAKVSQKDGEQAEAAIAWARGTTENTDYIYNLRTVVSAPSVVGKMAGIAASVISAWDRAMARETERAVRRDAACSTHQGTVGGKISFAGEVVMVRGCESRFGTTTIIKLVDASGNVYTWFASGGRDVARGERYAVTGTVKKHDEYKGEMQTVVTRCKIVEAAQAVA